MAELPVPASVYFKDFSLGIVKYEVSRENSHIAAIEGLPNEEYGEKYIHFPHGNDIAVGDILTTGNTEYAVRKISIDTYQGTPELLKAVYY